METRSNAAAALFTLSTLDTNKIKIGESGAIRPLVVLLEQGSSMAKKDVAFAIFNLCILHENKAMAVNDGVVRALLSMIMDQSYVDKSLALLAILASSVQAVEEMGARGALPCMLSIIRESTCGRNRENAVTILYSICCNDKTKLREIREEENKYGAAEQNDKVSWVLVDVENVLKIWKLPAISPQKNQWLRCRLMNFACDLLDL